MLKSVTHNKINNEKREVALKNEVGGDEKHLFFLLGLTYTCGLSCSPSLRVRNLENKKVLAKELCLLLAKEKLK